MNEENEDIGLVKINYEIFKNCLETYNNSNIQIPDNIVNKANELINNYSCFVSNYDARSLWEKKKIIAQNKTKIKTRPHIIYIDFSDDAKCKKEFISYLNKLTDVNKDVIYGKISHFITQINDEIKNSLFDILINFIKTSNNKIYIEILYLFDNDYIEKNITKYYENYLKNKEWLPVKIVIEHKLIFEEQYYDTYCEYIKIKKNTLSMIKALCVILKKINKVDIINQIMISIIYDLDNKPDLNNYKHITELLLDEYAIILDFIPKQEYIEYIKSFDISRLDNSTKFKVSNIVDKYK
uniref:Uncharacterized protein n=1 Tax=viral metagenome TaxID=1070528 RepID=A0A6C0CFS5_9ZZZZ